MTAADESAETKKPTLGIGSCLAGNAVRYNGDTKSANNHVRTLAEHFETRAFCPEMGIGLGVPRAPIHLVESNGGIRVKDVATHDQDYTAQIQQYAERVMQLAPELCGYILVKASPSCGYDRVKRFSEDGRLLGSDQQGVFAAALHKLDPLLPLEDDGRLNDPGLRVSFVMRALVYHDWKQLKQQGLSARKLLGFYTDCKYLVMAHHIPSYKEIGKMLATAGNEDIEELAQRFITQLMFALSKPATRRSHSNTLFHIAGYLKRKLDSAQRQRLAATIEDYRLGNVPLVVPVSLLQNHFADHPDDYIGNQRFLAHYPGALQLRNLI